MNGAWWWHRGPSELALGGRATYNGDHMSMWRHARCPKNPGGHMVPYGPPSCPEAGLREVLETS